MTNVRWVDWITMSVASGGWFCLIGIYTWWLMVFNRSRCQCQELINGDYEESDDCPVRLKKHQDERIKRRMIKSLY
jgi:hypothetical protein